MMTEEEWLAIKTNDKNYDQLFRYGVKTTRIYCRPSCPSRLPKRENIAIYHDLTEPEKRGYRPCKRCQTSGKVISQDVWVEEIKSIIEDQYMTDLSLSELSHLGRGSTSHVRHVFKKVTNQTPQQYLTVVRMNRAKELLLISTLSIEEIGTSVGISNVSYFIQSFKKYYGYTPKQYQKQKG